MIRSNQSRRLLSCPDWWRHRFGWSSDTPNRWGWCDPRHWLCLMWRFVPSQMDYQQPPRNHRPATVLNQPKAKPSGFLLQFGSLPHPCHHRILSKWHCKFCHHVTPPKCHLLHWPHGGWWGCSPWWHQQSLLNPKTASPVLEGCWADRKTNYKNHCYASAHTAPIGCWC